MKDLEKIKSEDLAAQVQDANPGNFAIEQEVAAMVGATVPQPTEPSADDARELGAQLLVFLRRALLPIRSALRTAVAAIYAHLDSRCTDYTPAAYDPFRLPAGPYDPMRPFVPRTLPNLLTALTAFSARKISDLGDCPDGISFLHLIGDSTVPVTEISDDNVGWTLNKSVTLPASVTKLTAKFKKATATISGAALEDVVLPELTDTGNENGSVLLNSASVKTISCDKVKRICGSIYNNANGELEELHIPEVTSARPRDWGMTYAYSDQSAPIVFACNSLKKVVSGLKVVADIGKPYNNNIFRNCRNLEWIKFGNPTFFSCVFGGNGGEWTKLLHLEFEDGVAINLNLQYWAPDAETIAHQDFLPNFLEHICQRLANRTGQTKLTLTLSAAVYTAIMTDNDIKAELVARNWKVTDGSNNYNN